MTPRTCLALLACCCALAAFAQPRTPLLYLDLPFSQPLMRWASDEAGQMHLLFQEGGDAVLYTLDPLTIEVAARRSFGGLPPAAQLLALTVQRDSCWIYHLGPEGTVQVQTLALQQRNPRLQALPEARLGGRSAYWGSFTYQGQLHVLRLLKGGNRVRICRFDRGSSFYIQEYPVRQPQLLAGLEAGMQQIDLAAPPAMESSWRPSKVVLDGDQLRLCADGPDSVHLATIDLNAGTLTESAYAMPLRGARSASDLREGHLFLYSQTPDSVAVRGIDLLGGAEVLAWTWKPGDGAPVLLAAVAEDGTRQPAEQAAAWLRNSTALPHAAIAVQPLEHGGWEIAAGGLDPLITTGLAGVVVDERYRLQVLRVRLPVAPQGEALAGSPRLGLEPRFRRGTVVMPAARGSKRTGYFDPAQRTFVLY
ncbi:MAG: hypothetical protein NW241_08135 [Bacteroidia bacterium]|nr:hypothetical protein [Bacteroidia bacterium]